MGKAYRIKRFDHVTTAKRRRLLEEGLVPVLDESPADAPGFKDYFREGDWLVEYRYSNKALYIYKVKAYHHKPHLDLYIKHFIEADIIYKLGSTYLSDDTHILLARANHLEALPPHVFDMFNRYQDKVNTDPDEKIKQLVFLLGIKRNTMGSIGKKVILELENGKLTAAELKGMLNKQLPTNEAVHRSRIKPVVELVDPSNVTGAISKAALEAYIKTHDGQLPTVKEFDKLTKRFIATGIRRRKTVGGKWY
jgi:hypothetical protein